MNIWLINHQISILSPSRIVCSKISFLTIYLSTWQLNRINIKSVNQSPSIFFLHATKNCSLLLNTIGSHNCNCKCFESDPVESALFSGNGSGSSLFKKWIRICYVTKQWQKVFFIIGLRSCFLIVICPYCPSSMKIYA